MRTHFVVRIALLAAAAVLALPPKLNANIPGVRKTLEKNESGYFNVLPKVANILNRIFALETQKWWKWNFSLPIPQNPTFTPTADCSNGQSGHVWYLYGGPPTVTCNIPFGKSVFFPVVNTECSDLEIGTPFYGKTSAERAACAKSWIDGVTNLSATIDGIKIKNLSLFRTQSGDFGFTVPDNSILGIPGPASGFATGDGYYLLLPLPLPGKHTIHITGTFHDPFDPTHPVVFPLDTVITLIVKL